MIPVEIEGEGDRPGERIASEKLTENEKVRYYIILYRRILAALRTPDRCAPQPCPLCSSFAATYAHATL